MLTPARDLVAVIDSDGALSALAVVALVLTDGRADALVALDGVLVALADVPGAHGVFYPSEVAERFPALWRA